jgi:hypothetical protein
MTKYQENLLNQVAKGDVDLALDSLVAYLPKINSEYANDVITLSSRYNMNKRKTLIGVLDWSEAKLEYTQVTYALAQYINLLSEEEIEQLQKIDGNNTNHCIKDKILGICIDEPSKSKLNDFFTGLNFINAEAKLFSEYKNPENYKLIVFDCHTIDDPEQPEEGQETALMSIFPKLIKEKYFTVFFGNHYENIKKVREWVQPANSRFSLYARIQEVLNYINTFHFEEK